MAPGDSPFPIPPEGNLTDPKFLFLILAQGCYYVAGKAIKLTPSMVKWIRRKLKDYHEKKRYGCSMDMPTSQALSKIKDTGLYKQLTHLIGESHFCIPFFEMGLFVHFLNYRGRRDRVAEIRQTIHHKHKVKGLRILEIASTGALPSIIEHLTTLRNEGYGREEIHAGLLQTIKKWDAITIFVTNEDTIKGVRERIDTKMGYGHEFFFVFGIGDWDKHHKKKAGLIAASAISELSNERLIRRYKYSEPVENFHIPQSDGIIMYAWRFKKPKVIPE
ncbi:hypothetical protein ACFLRF_06025 [Candidatus Altiarchaeota archaeon]